MTGKLMESPRQVEALDCAGRTAGGGGQPSNQDRFLIGHLNRTLLVSESNTLLGSRSRVSGSSIAHLLLVADGLGDADSGEAAAEAAAEALARELVLRVPSFFGLDSDLEDRLQTELDRAVARCHRSVEHVERRARPEPASGDGDDACGDGDGTEPATDVPHVGTTLTAAYLLWPRMYLVHLGDSRCYRLRAGSLERLTADHVRRLPAGEAERGGRPGVLTNALGAGIRRPAPDLRRVDLRTGDALLLCTGGLARALGERELARTLARASSAEAACEALVGAAARAGTGDDVTAVVARFRPAAERVPPGVEP